MDTCRPIDRGVSFVVIAYNEQRGIEAALETILLQQGLGDFEVLVVDDCSQDGTAAIVRAIASKNPMVTLIGLAKNGGRGHARAVGVEAARFPLVAMVDADCRLPTDWFARCLAALDDCDVAGGVAVPDGDVAYIHRRFGLRPRPTAGEATITGSNGLYKKAVFREVSFESSLRNGEDVAINHALSAGGFRVWRVPNLFVEHVESKSFLHSMRWLFESGVGAQWQFRRYRQVRLPDVAYAGFIAATVASVVGRRRAAPTTPGVFVLIAAIAHTGRRFVYPEPTAVRFGGAVFVDALLLFAYFAGRTLGLVQNIVAAEMTAAPKVTADSSEK